jgi:hypothetical protein
LTGPHPGRRQDIVGIDRESLVVACSEATAPRLLEVQPETAAHERGGVRRRRGSGSARFD